MATLDDSIAVTAAISVSEATFDGSGSKPGDNGVTGLEESGGNLVVSTKQVVEVETVVETNREVETAVETNCEVETVVETNREVETAVETNCEVETVVETNCEPAPINQETGKIVSNRGKSSLVNEVETVAESLLDREVQLESSSVNKKTDEIVSNGDKSAPVDEAGVGIKGHGNSSGTSIDSYRAVDVKETVEESSLACETELHSSPVDQQIDDVSLLNNVYDVGVQTNGNGHSIDTVDGLPSGLVNQQADVVSTVNSVASDDCVENNGNGYSIETGTEECQDSDLDDGDAMDITVSQLISSKGSLKGTVDAEGKQQDHGFRVGDFVWGKIKSHPWWPGQIFDTNDASDDARKCNHEGRLLVAFFGDGSYSWCFPSQLEPFVDKFDDMSTGSQSGSFLHAIREAVNEFGRIVETKMVCNCIPEEKRVGLAKPVVENAGIRAGVLTPEVESCRVSVPEFEPIELLSELRQFAVAGHVDNALDLAMMRSWLSAFYRLKCGRQFPTYCDPLPIEGMEDQDHNVTAIDNDLSVAVEAPVSGPADWLSSPTKTQPDEKNSHKRKHKSIAELIGKNTNVKRKSRKKATGKEGTDLVIETSLLEGKKSDDSSSGKISSNRKNNVSESSEIADNTVLNAETSNHAEIYGTSQGSLSEKPKEIEVPPAEVTPREEKDALEALSSPRERKKSKYLSPPYTNVAWRMGYSSFKAYTEIESEYKKSKKVNKTQAMEEDDGLLERVDVSVVKSPEAVKDDKKLSFSVSDADAPVDALLSKIHCAAVNPFYLSRDGSFDMVFAFCSAMRKSTYAHEPDYKTLRSHKGSVPRKRKLSSLQCEIPQNDEKSPKSVEEEEIAKSKKKRAKTTGLESNAGDAERKFAPSLIMIFKPGTALPSKEDIVDHYSKFGRLFEHDTRVMPDSQLVQIVFMKEAEATKAFEASMQDNSFGFENLLCDMLQTSPRSRSGAPCLDASAPEEEVSHDLASDVRGMASKLILMSTTLEKYHSKFSEDDKLMLKEEMKLLKEKAVNLCRAVETISELRG